MLPAIVFGFSFVLCCLMVASYVYRDMSEMKAATEHMKAATSLLERAEKSTAEINKNAADRMEADDARYEALKVRLDKIEEKDRPVRVTFTEPIPILFPKEKTSPLKGVKPPSEFYPPMKTKVKGTRATQ